MAALAACGDGSGSATNHAETTTLTVTGTAATGLAIPGATVTGKCKVGTGTATTLADGSYTLTVTDGHLPCVLQINNPEDGIKLHTVVVGIESTASATANITPLTEMATAHVLGSEPNVFFAAFDAVVATQKITTTAVQAAQTDIGLVLTGTVDITAMGSFISMPFKAATQGSLDSGDVHDKLLDALKLKLSSAQIGTLTTALANGQTTDSIKQTVAGMIGGGSSTPVAPVANAGAAQSVVTGTTVTLDASISSAAAGRTLTYAWAFTFKPAGSAATLTALTTAKPSFVADVAGIYVATVIVNDGTTASSAAAVAVTASVANAAPVANAGITQNVVIGTTVTLDGSASSDANRDWLSYEWTMTAKPLGSVAVLNFEKTAWPYFTADLTGSYVVSLTVNDGRVNSINVATVNITTAFTPVANAGSAQNVFTNTLATLDGSTSSDPNGFMLTYAWSLISKPNGSAALLTGATSAQPSFTPDLAGAYIASLVVDNGVVKSNALTVTVNGLLKPNPTAVGTGLLIQDYTGFRNINEGTMTTSLTSSCGVSFVAIDQRPDGILVGVTGENIYEIDVNQPTCISKGLTPELIRAFAVDSTGKYWGVSSNTGSAANSQRLHRLNADGSTGGVVYLSGATTYITGMDFNSAGELLGIGRALVNNWPTDIIVKVDRNTGVTTFIASLPESPAGDIDIDGAGVMRFIRNSELIFVSSITGLVINRSFIPNFSGYYVPIVFIP